MVLRGLLKFFGGGGVASPSKSSASSAPGKVPEDVKDLECFVDYVVRALVDYPDQVKVIYETRGQDESLIKIDCNKDDVGKIVGKKGKTIMAIRSLVSGAAGRMQKKVSVEVND